MASTTVLHQAENWVDSTGEVWALDDMTASHRRNLLRFLRRRATHLEIKDGIALLTSPFAPRGDWAYDGFDDAMDWRAEHPQEWLETTALVTRLRELVAEDHTRQQMTDERFITPALRARRALAELPVVDPFDIIEQRATIPDSPPAPAATPTPRDAAIARAADLIPDRSFAWDWAEAIVDALIDNGDVILTADHEEALRSADVDFDTYNWP